MGYRFITADVFTDRTFGGNPLAVLPNGRGLDDQQMQAIAREFNLSETVFVLPPDTAGSTRKLRIFTPASELPFAGHPTIGTALVLARLGEIELAGARTRIVFEEGAGPVPVEIEADGGQASFAWLSAPRAPTSAPPPMSMRSPLCSRWRRTTS
jgi:trans-2,3-dihydro-3-hydroxyanthranilate isomerase